MFSRSGNRKSGAAGAASMPSIVARDLRIVGDLASEGDIQVDGSIEGDVRTGHLTISENGRVRGAIEADAVIVAGAVTGSIKAKNVTLLRSARVVADIVQDQFSVEAGALFEGSSRRLTTEEPASGRTDAAVAPPVALPVVLKVAGGSAKSEAGGG